MSIGVKKAALAVFNLKKADRDWILSQLEPAQRSNVLAEIEYLRSRKGVASLSFNEVLQLGKGGMAFSSEATSHTADRKERLKEVDVERLSTALSNSNPYTKWLLFSSQNLPSRTQLTQSLSSSDQYLINEFNKKQEASNPWLIELAEDWLLEEVAR